MSYPVLARKQGWFRTLGPTCLVACTTFLTASLGSPASSESFRSTLEKVNRHMLALQNAHLPAEYRLVGLVLPTVVHVRLTKHYLREDFQAESAKDTPDIDVYDVSNPHHITEVGQSTVIDCDHFYQDMMLRTIILPKPGLSKPDGGVKLLQCEQAGTVEGRKVWFTEWLDRGRYTSYAFDRESGFLVREEEWEGQDKSSATGFKLTDLKIRQVFDDSIFTNPQYSIPLHIHS